MNRYQSPSNLQTEHGQIAFFGCDFPGVDIIKCMQLNFTSSMSVDVVMSKTNVVFRRTDGLSDRRMRIGKRSKVQFLVSEIMAKNCFP